MSLPSPLSSNRTWYEAGLGFTPRLRMPALPETADVAIIGGGFTGLWTALRLAERGVRAVVLEADRIGAGASGRNGGQICTGYAKEPPELLDRFGKEKAARLWDLSEVGKARLLESIRTYGWEVDLALGYITAALKPAHLDGLRAVRDTAQGVFGYSEMDIIEARDIRDAVDSPRYCGGLRDRGSGQLHPLKLVHALAGEVDALGGVISEKSTVGRVASNADGSSLLHLSDGRTVKSDAVLVATNAHLPKGLSPEIDKHLRPRIMPVLTWIAVTEPLGESVARSLIPGGEAVADTAFALDYYRITPDHRLLYGGPLSYRIRDPKGPTALMQRGIRRLFPQLPTPRIDHLWAGWVGITPQRLPHLGRLEGSSIFYAHGFSGQGVVLTQSAGSMIADAMSDSSSDFETFAQLPQPSFPGGRILRHPLQIALSNWYLLQDRL